MINLKIESIAMGGAYDEFRRRWLVKQFTSNWAEYRLSALRMIKIILTAIAPVDLSPIAYVDAAGSEDREVPPILLGVSRPGDTFDSKAKITNIQLGKEIVL